ncbi:MAG: hypothetical protein RLN88_15025 [Ekhidna sp.]|uniref:hypothetical protein n=1 Tax=Ekhidna sp. TaxID=2608089 RepID=UPI0032EDEB9D
MSIQNQLAHALGRNDQEPNREVAQKIADSDSSEEVKELVDFIQSKPKKRAQMDAMLALAYVGERNPKLLAPHVDFLVSRLDDPINRVVFGSMITMANIAHLIQLELFDQLPKIIDAMDSGTVVTRDYGFKIMVTLYQDKGIQEDMFLLMQEQLMKAPSNQLGQYAERLMEVLNKNHLKPLIDTLEERRNDVSNEHHIKRLNKNLKKLYKQL